jgi:hypothetical protein
MASQGRSRGTRGLGRSSQVAPSSPVLAAASAGGSGSSTGTTTRPSTTSSHGVRTRATYRLLLLRGLAPDEAANLTAFVSGIHVGGAGWKLQEVNRLLFLRELNRSGRFGESDGGSPSDMTELRPAS